MGQISKLGSIDTPKSIGEYLGVVKKMERTFFIIDSKQDLHNGDGICFFDWQQNLSGTTVNGVEGNKVYLQKMNEIRVGQKIYRNYDHQFAQKLLNNPAERKINLSIIVQETQSGLLIAGTDEDGNKATVEVLGDKKPALKKETAKEAFHNQLSRLGNTIFQCSDLMIDTKDMYFVPASKLNDARRQFVEQLLKIREENRPHLTASISKNNVPYPSSLCFDATSPQKHLSFTGNVLNKKAEDFYHRHGVETIEPAAESGLNMIGQRVMRTKYCLRRELNLCQRANGRTTAEPLILQDEDGREYEVKFLCEKCLPRLDRVETGSMEIFLGGSED
jgi:putative protease